jgi:hypothetical protein
MSAGEVVVQPHRRTLAKTRLESLIRTVHQHGMRGESLGAAVAYRPSVGYVLIGGEHRWAALSAPGVQTTVIVLRSWDDLVAWMAIDITDSRRIGWDPVSAVAFYEKAVAALKPSRGDRPLEDVAEFVGIHRGILESVRWANALLADPDEDAAIRAYVQEELDGLERGSEGGHSLRDRVAKYRAKLANAGRAPESAAVQRKALSSIPQLIGIVDALANLGPINPELSMAEREAYARQLGSLGAQLAKIKKNLRGETA